jgi:hypothetical protein
MAAAPPARAVEDESNDAATVAEDVAARLVPGGTIHLPLDDAEIDVCPLEAERRGGWRRCQHGRLKVKATP